LRRFIERSRDSGKKSHNMVIAEMEKKGVLDDLESLGKHPKVEAAKGRSSTRSTRTPRPRR